MQGELWHLHQSNHFQSPALDIYLVILKAFVDTVPLWFILLDNSQVTVTLKANNKLPFCHHFFKSFKQDTNQIYAPTRSWFRIHLLPHAPLIHLLLV